MFTDFKGGIGMKEVIKKKRLFNIELLRIIAMFFIVCHHMLNYSGLGRENIVFCIVNTLVSPCVNIFVLISGYFLVDSKFKAKKIIKLYLQIVFYYLFCTVLFRYVFNIGILSKEDITSIVFPILYPQEWFSICYMVLYILSPFLNKMLHNINKKEHAGLIITLIIFAYLQRFPGFRSYLDFNYGYSIIWFITLYVVAAFIKFYYKKEKHQKYIIPFGVIATSTIIFIFYKFQINHIYLTPLFISGEYIAYSSILVLILSILIFILFLNIDIKNEKIGKIINKCSSTTFAIYLIHSANFSRVFFENYIKQSIELFGYKLFPITLIIIILLIFECGILVDLFRQLIEKKTKYILDRLKCEVKR